MLCKFFFVITICLTLIFPEASRAQNSSGIINNFAFKLGNILAQDSDKNFFASPFSIISAFGMAYNGASGETKNEIEKVLNLNHDANKNIMNLAKELNDDKILYSANALWFSDRINLRRNFRQILLNGYKTEIHQSNFKNEPTKSKNIINNWVSEKTNNKINNFINSLDTETKMILINAVYFNSEWRYKFDNNLTSLEFFKVPNARNLKIPMMKQNRNFLYCELEGNKIIEIPYKNNISMYVILPAENDLNIFKNFTPEKFAGMLESLKIHRVDLWLPKFKVENSFELKNIFESLGIKLAFSNRADFSRITNDEKLKIDSVLHKTFIEVDEAKTEASAATGLTMVGITAMPVDYPEAEFHADRPFIYFIADSSGNILFMGRQTFK